MSPEDRKPVVGRESLYVSRFGCLGSETVQVRQLALEKLRGGHLLRGRRHRRRRRKGDPGSARRCPTCDLCLTITFLPEVLHARTRRAGSAWRRSAKRCASSARCTGRAGRFKWRPACGWSPSVSCGESKEGALWSCSCSVAVLSCKRWRSKLETTSSCPREQTLGT